MAVLDTVNLHRALQGRQHNSRDIGRAVRLLHIGLGALANHLIETGAGHQVVHQFPVQGSLAPDTFRSGAEKVRVIAPHMPFIHQPGEATGPRQHREQRQFGQGNRTRPIVDQQNAVASERQLITAAGSSAVNGAQIRLPGMCGGILNAVAGFIGEFAEINLMGVGRLGQHANVGTGTKHAWVGRRHNHRRHFRVLKAQPLHGIIELDVHPKIVGVELQFIAGAKRRIFLNIHSQHGDPAVKR